jgi:hypothetical protein
MKPITVLQAFDLTIGTREFCIEFTRVVSDNDDRAEDITAQEYLSADDERATRMGPVTPYADLHVDDCAAIDTAIAAYIADPENDMTPEERPDWSYGYDC